MRTTGVASSVPTLLQCASPHTLCATVNTVTAFTRRRFLSRSAAGLVLPAALHGARDLSCDVAIIGASTGGCAAALAALRNGMRVVMTEETDWIGGQLTSQAVPPDEHPWIESFGGTLLYRHYRQAVREYYRQHFPLTPDIRQRLQFNPGGGSVSRLTHEPRVSLAVLTSLLAPYLGGGRLTLLPQHKPIAADIANDRIRAVTVQGADGARRTVTAPYYLDATELGDLLPLTKTEYVTGFESRRDTNEPHAPETAQPNNHQAFTVCFAISHHAGEDHTVDKPAEYSFWRDYIPRMTPAWPGKLLSWQMSDPITLKPRAVRFDPEDKPGQGLNLWIYRRIAAREHFAPGSYNSDISLVNWPQNDYWLGNLHDNSPDEAARHLQRGRQLSLSLLYWMQTEAPRPDGGQGWRGLRIRPDQTGTPDGLAKYPYVRESRRIRAEFTVLEQHVGSEARAKLLGKKPEEVTAEVFPDSVGVGSYRIDLHPSSGGDNYVDVSSLPFQIPLGALLPRRMENLLAACKNIGTTHITNGCYRLHPVEWNIGESAGTLAAHAVATKQTPRQIRRDPKPLAEFQAKLASQGVEIAWPRLTPR